MHVNPGMPDELDDLLANVFLQTLRAALTPITVRLALRRLRRGGSLRCAVRSVAAPVAGLPSSWLDGAATLAPGRFVLDTRAGERVDLVVGTVVETTARTHRDRGLGPNRLGICQLRTSAGTVLWAAHPALLAAGAAVLRDEA